MRLLRLGPRSSSVTSTECCRTLRGQEEGALPQGLIRTCTTYRIFLSDLLGFSEPPLIFRGSVKAKLVQVRTHTVLPALVGSCIHLLSKRVTFYRSGCRIQYQETPGVPRGILSPARVRCPQRGASEKSAHSRAQCKKLQVVVSGFCQLILNPQSSGARSTGRENLFKTAPRDS